VDGVTGGVVDCGGVDGVVVEGVADDGDTVGVIVGIAVVGATVVGWGVKWGVARPVVAWGAGGDGLPVGELTPAGAWVYVTGAKNCSEVAALE